MEYQWCPEVPGTACHAAFSSELVQMEPPATAASLLPSAEEVMDHQECPEVPGTTTHAPFVPELIQIEPL